MPKWNPQFITKDFFGTVILKDWMTMLNGETYLGVTGKISIFRDKDILGFEVSKSESNWCCRVEGATTSVNILGCQIRGAIVHGPERPGSRNVYKVD